MTQNENSTTFTQALTDLTDFNDYFTDDEKIKQLVCWLHDDFSINKSVARLAVKRIAPFVLARAADLGKILGKAWMRKLHDRLNHYDWYLQLTQGLLKTLVSHTDNTLATAFEIPSDENLAALLSDKARWISLKPEQQGLVQLLMGQNSLNEGLDIHTGLLNQIIDTLSVELELNTPETLQKRTKNTTQQQAQWLTYTHRQARLIGRERDLQQLDEFCQQDTNFSWRVITGAAGIGKSRLALEALIQQQNIWQVGFLRTVQLTQPHALQGWQPHAPTFIVIDYAVEYAQHISEWLDHFIDHQDDYAFPVRLLILERETKQQAWWQQLLDGTSAALNRKSQLYMGQPHELNLLTRSQQQQALQSFLKPLQSDNKLPDEDNDFWDELHKLSNKGRPLFIGMVALTIADKGFQHIREWNQMGVLKAVLQREQTIWRKQLGIYSGEQQKQIHHLIAFNCMAGELNTEDDKQLQALDDALIEQGLADNTGQLEDYFERIVSLTNHRGAYLQPDLFAEFYVLQHWQTDNVRIQRKLTCYLNTAYRFSPENTAAFIYRSATDYPKNAAASQWWRWLYHSSEQKENKQQLEKLVLGYNHSKKATRSSYG